MMEPRSNYSHHGCAHGDQKIQKRRVETISFIFEISYECRPMDKRNCWVDDVQKIINDLIEKLSGTDGVSDMTLFRSFLRLRISVVELEQLRPF